MPLRFAFLISNADLVLTIGNYTAVADDEPQADSLSLVGLQDSLNFVDPQGIGKLGH